MIPAAEGMAAPIRKADRAVIRQHLDVLFRRADAIGPGCLVLLCHKLAVSACLWGWRQHGHRVRRLTSPRIKRRRIEPIELGSCRWARAGTPWAEVFG